MGIRSAGLVMKTLKNIFLSFLNIVTNLFFRNHHDAAVNPDIFF